jgi:hypothetical protein
MLWQASRLPFHGAAWHWTRLFLIGGVLIASAISGGILATAAGWGISFFATVGTVALRSLNPRHPRAVHTSFENSER